MNRIQKKKNIFMYLSYTSKKRFNLRGKIIMTKQIRVR